MSTAELSSPAAPEPRPLDVARLRSPALIAGTLVLSVIVAGVQASPVRFGLCGLLVLVIVPCAVIDIELRIIPNLITGPAALVAILTGTVLDSAGEPNRLLWAAAAGGFLLITALINPAGMGMGDVKLLGVIGLCLGPAAVAGLLLALLGQVAAAVVIAAGKGIRAARRTTLPFGPYLAVGAIIAALAGSSLLHG